MIVALTFDITNFRKELQNRYGNVGRKPENGNPKVGTVLFR